MRGPETDQLDSKKITAINLQILGHHPSVWRVANSFLHALNFSAKNAKFYAPLLVGKFGMALALAHIWRGFVNVVMSFAFIGPRFFGNKIPPQTDILFITHLNQPASYESETDQYFGHIPDKIALDGLTSAMVMLNQCRARKGAIENVATSRNVPRIICAPYLSPLLEAWHFLGLLFSGIASVGVALLTRGVTRRVGVFAGLVQASARSLVGLRIRHQILNLIEKTNPQKIVFTYEGHPWERLICQLVRARFPTIELIGYQHSVVLNGPKAMSNDVPQILTPHKLLVTSALTADLLRNDGGIIPSKTVPVGSTKFIAPSSQQTRKSPNSLLVVPEGTPEETLPMVEFAIALSHVLQKQGSAITVILRLHPLLNFDWLKSHCGAAMTAPDNVIFSAQSLAEDARDAGWILYRGSTAVFTAVAFGGRPLFLEFDGDAPENDPLAMAGPYRQSVTSIEGALALMVNDQKAWQNHNEGGSFSAEQMELVNFAANYFPPLDEIAFLQELRSSWHPNG